MSKVEGCVNVWPDNTIPMTPNPPRGGIDACRSLINYNMRLKQYLVCTQGPKLLEAVVNGKRSPLFFVVVVIWCWDTSAYCGELMQTDCSCHSVSAKETRTNKRGKKGLGPPRMEFTSLFTFDFIGRKRQTTLKRNAFVSEPRAGEDFFYLCRDFHTYSTD